MIKGLIVKVLLELFSRGLSWLLEYFHNQHDTKETNDSIDARLLKFKAAYSEVYDGKPITKDQREKLRIAIADFIRNADNGGL